MLPPSYHAFQQVRISSGYQPLTVPAISACGILGASGDTVVSALGTDGTDEDTGVSAPVTLERMSAY